MEDAAALIGNGETEKAKALLEENIIAGCTDSMVLLGTVLSNGTEEEKKRSLSLFKEAAELGNSSGMRNLAYCYCLSRAPTYEATMADPDSNIYGKSVVLSGQSGIKVNGEWVDLVDIVSDLEASNPGRVFDNLSNQYSTPHTEIAFQNETVQIDCFKRRFTSNINPHHNHASYPGK